MSEVKLKQQTVDNASAIQADFVLDGTELKLEDDITTIAKIIPSESTLTAESLREAAGVFSQAKEAFPLAFGNRAIEALETNPELAYVQGSCNVGISTIDCTLRREGTVSAGIPKKGEKAETKQVKGKLDVSVVTQSGSEIGRVKKMIASVGELRL